MVDWPKRYDAMQQHTAQHLLSAIAGRVAHVDTVKWEFFPDSVVVDFTERERQGESTVTPPLQSLIAAVEEGTNEAIRAAAAVSWRLVPKEELDLYPQARGEVKGAALDMQHLRLIFIDGIDVNPCGGKCNLFSTVQNGNIFRRHSLAVHCRDTGVEDHRVREGPGRNAAQVYQWPPAAAAPCKQHGA